MVRKVRSEVTSVVHSLPWLIAQDEGLFAAEEIEAELVRAPQRGTWKNLAAAGPKTFNGRDLVQDPRVVDSIGVHLIFEEGACKLYEPVSGAKSVALRTAIAGAGSWADARR